MRCCNRGPKRHGERALAALLLFIAQASTAALAQEAPPRGPADIINKARQARDVREQAIPSPSDDREPQAAGGTSDQAPREDSTREPTAPAGDPHGGLSRQALQRALGQAPPIATAKPDAAVAAGTVRITVVDVSGTPIPKATVRIGTMEAAGKREQIYGKTDASGIFEKSGLPHGPGKSYRVNVPYEGATYSSTPFQLPADRGYDVRIVRLPVTRDATQVVQVVGQTMMELREDRLHVIQQAQLMNVGDQTYVFPDEGTKIALPAGHEAFQSQPMMTDQRIVPTEGGFTLHGSLHPGVSTLVWAFDVPTEGEQLNVSWPLAFRTFQYRVMTDAAPEITLDVEGFPAPEVIDDGQRPLYVTGIRQNPSDAQLDRIAVSLSGLPTPGPLRWMALGGMLVLLLGGLLSVGRGGRADAVLARARVDRKASLLTDAENVEQMFESGEIGPKYHARRMTEIVDEIASVLRDEATQDTAAERNLGRRRG